MSVTTVPYRTVNYSDYLTQVASLIGIDQGDLQTPELTMLNNFFNRAFRKMWESSNYVELCPVNEVRFPQNLLTYPNDYSQTAYWTATNLTAGSPAYPNPMDNRSTACALTETAGNGVHTISQSVALLPNQNYTFTGYTLPQGRNYIYVQVTDGVYTYTAFYNLLQPSPGVQSVSVSAGGVAPSANLQLSGNGYYFWSFSFQTAPTMTPLSGTYTFGLSPDGTTTSYAGNTAYGVRHWGNTGYILQNIVPAAYYVPFAQLGETAIETVFAIYATDPGGGFNPSLVNYNTTPQGLEIIGPSSIGPLWFNYRPQRPIFSGTTFNASNTYSVGQNIYFTSTNTLTSGYANYYSCTVATTAGQSPDTNPNSWQTQFIPYILLPYCVYNAYGDWLQTEGQAQKAQAMYAYAQTCMDDENDKQERQGGNIIPWRVNTHLTSQQRGMGYQNQTYLPNGSYYIV